MRYQATLFSLIALSLCFGSCNSSYSCFEPSICLTPMPHHIGNLPRAFEPLRPEEKKSDWGKELLIGRSFAKEMDLYRAITSFKRAKMLIPPNKAERSLEIEYNIVQSYYLGCKYQDAINEFEASDLKYVPATFPAFHDLLLIIYDSYVKLCQPDQAEKLLLLIEEYYPETAEKLKRTEAVENADFCALRSDPATNDFLRDYCCTYKSPKKAQFLNAILPGSGYAYLGERQSAWTSFAINTLFIAASYHFFKEGNYAAGIITTSLECGWYFGGINGAGLEAQAHNKAMYETLAKGYLCKEKLFPVLMFQTTF